MWSTRTTLHQVCAIYHNIIVHQVNDLPQHHCASGLCYLPHYCASGQCDLPSLCIRSVWSTTTLCIRSLWSTTTSLCVRTDLRLCSNSYTCMKGNLCWIQWTMSVQWTMSIQCHQDVKQAETTGTLYCHSSARFMCRNLWRKLRFLQQCFTPDWKQPLCLLLCDLLDFRFDGLIHVKALA